MKTILATILLMGAAVVATRDRDDPAPAGHRTAALPAERSGGILVRSARILSSSGGTTVQLAATNHEAPPGRTHLRAWSPP